MIDQEKREWMKQVGMRELRRPVKYVLGEKRLFSEDYISGTPLEQLQTRFAQTMIDQAKREWMKQVGMGEFKQPMKYSLHGHGLFSEAYLENTPLEKLKEVVASTPMGWAEDGYMIDEVIGLREEV